MADVSFLAPLNSKRQFPADRLHSETKTTITFQVTERDQCAAVNLVGVTGLFRAKADFTDATWVFENTVIVTDAVNGLATVELSDTDIVDPEELWAELVLTDASLDQFGNVAYFLPVQRGGDDPGRNPDTLVYYRLRADKGWIKGVKIGPGEKVVEEDVARAERYATSQITEYLGKRWVPPLATPESIAEIAHKLAASQVLLIVHRNTLRGGDDALMTKLEKQAREELKMIRGGKKGILLRDGQWDPRFVGGHNSEEGRTGGIRIII